MKTIDKILIGCFLLTALAPAQARKMIAVEVENGSTRENRVQVVDTICDKSMPAACRLAAATADSDRCRKNENSEECRQAHNIMQASDRVAGLILNRTLSGHERTSIRVCTDHSGKGRIKTRNSVSGAWTLHSWVREGDTIRVK